MNSGAIRRAWAVSDLDRGKNPRNAKSNGYGLPAILLAAVAGFMLAHAIGLSYVAAARHLNLAVFETYRNTMEAELSNMPPPAQLIASYASDRAMENAIGRNSDRSLLNYLFWTPSR